MIDSTSTKLSGEIKACMAENMPPARPPKLAPWRRQQLHVARVDAHRRGSDLILADRFPGAADPRVLAAGG